MATVNYIWSINVRIYVITILFKNKKFDIEKYKIINLYFHYFKTKSTVIFLMAPCFDSIYILIYFCFSIHVFRNLIQKKYCKWLFNLFINIL